MMSKHPLYNTTGLQKNNKSHVLYALANKQMELKSVQEEYEAKILKIKRDLQALETTICLFDSDCEETIKKISNAPKKRREKRTFFKMGETRTVILKVLREANEFISTEEISKRAIIHQELDKDDLDILKYVGKSVIAILRKLEKSEIIISNSTICFGKMLAWKIRD